MTTPTAISISFTEAELKLLKNALHSFIADFGHDEADVRTEAQRLLAKLDTAHRG